MNKKLILCCAGAAILTACTGKKQQPASLPQTTDTLFLLTGSYADAGQEGIKVYLFNQSTGESRYVSGLKGISNPSYQTVSKDGKWVYSVGEDDGGTAAAHALTFDSATGSLTLTGSQPTQGAAPCHITLSPDESHVLTANYGGGSITVFPLDKQRRLQPGHVIRFQGKGADPERQSQPHLHCVYFTPDAKLLMANDLGTDRIHCFPVNEQGKGLPLLNEDKAFDFPLPPGSGPRHTAFAPDGRHAYLISELSGEVFTIAYSDRGLKAIQGIEADTLDAQGSADIHVSPDGKYVYASNRLKGDGIAIFKIEADGRLSKAGYQPTGIHPRNFAITPNGKFLLVACRDTHEIQVFARNASTGLLTPTANTIKTHKPVCLKFISY